MATQFQAPPPQASTPDHRPVLTIREHGFLGAKDPIAEAVRKGQRWVEVEGITLDLEAVRVILK